MVVNNCGRLPLEHFHKLYAKHQNVLQGQVEFSADGASVLVKLVCRYDGVAVVMFAATTPPAMRALMVAAV